MNRIKGSMVAKLLVWFIMIAASAACVGSLVLIVVMAGLGIFEQNREEILTSQYAEMNRSNSARVLEDYRQGNREESDKYFTDDGFCYGIIEAESLDGIDLNRAESYLIRNFEKRITRDELWQEEYTLTEDAAFWQFENFFTNHAVFENRATEKTLYADAICYDTAGGLFYYRAEGDYYPVQKLELVVASEVQEGYWIRDYDFQYNKEKKSYDNLYALEQAGEKIYAQNNILTIESMEEESSTWIGDKELVFSMQPRLELGSEALYLLTSEKSVTFDRFEETVLTYDQLGNIIFDGIRVLHASELEVIDSTTMPATSFIEVEDAYLDQYYTLHVNEENTTKHYYVLSYVDQSMVEEQKQEFLEQHKDKGLEAQLMAVLEAQDMDSYVKTELFTDIFYELKEDIVVVCIGTFVIGFAGFLFLMCAAGYRKNQREVVLTFVDRIPWDVFITLVFFVEGICICPLVLAVESNSITVIVQTYIGVGIVMAVLAVLTFLSFAVRYKNGKWWRNSLIYWVYAKLRDFCRAIWRNFGLLWKVLLVQFAISFVVFLFGGMLGIPEETFAILLIINIMVCPLFVMVIKQFGKLQTGSKRIAQGDMQNPIDTQKMFWEFKKHAENLNRINEGMSAAVEERMKSERFKTELITNVSHDIKTPLTSIINYVDLLQKTEIQDETAKEYLEVLERQSARLKKLIEDLIEASKASTGNLPVSMDTLEANVFVTQILGEFEEKLANAGLELIVSKPDEEISLRADGRHLWRVVDNLMNNICKYAQSGSRVYVNLEQTQDEILFTFRNMSKYPLNITSEELMERFVRGDSSRNTEGNGLGLSIAKSLMELMDGQLLLYVDGDLFKVVLKFSK